jgi:hypothetical protein
MKKSLVDKDKRDSMVVLLEGYPEEDIDATLPKEKADEAESVDEAMEVAEDVEEGGSPIETATAGLQKMVDDWQPETEEGETYLREVQDLLMKLS